MTGAQWQEARQLFEEVIDLAPAAAKGRLAQVAATEPEVAAEVQSLLDHHSRAGEFLSVPAGEQLGDLLDDSPHFDSGAAVGPYTIDREIGRGGMGRVYLATDGRLGRSVALKLLPPSVADDQAQRERLRREARAAAGLSHPGICTVYALEELDGHLLIASEFIDGRSLRAEIEEGPVPSAARVEQAALELSEALASAHQRGITHRDLKPENIMRARDGRLKILDFGLALVDASSSALVAEMPRLTQPGAIVGTPAYMAPEQLKGGVANARSDVFALGVVLYEYATGTHPFEATTALGMAARALESAPAALLGLRTDLSSGVAEAIDRAMRKLPQERFPSAIEFRRALTGSGLASSSTAAPVARWWRRHQIVAMLLYLAASAAAWQVKEWIPGPPRSIFLLVGLLAVIAAVFRGHLLFAERMNQRSFPAERRRVAAATLITDLAIGVALLADGGLVADSRAVWSLLVMGLGVGVALARVVVEPATTHGAFGDLRAK